MAVDRGKPTLVPTSKPKPQAHWWDQPKPAPKPKPVPLKRTKPAPAPRGNVTAPQASPAGRVQPVAQPKPRAQPKPVIAPRVAAHGRNGPGNQAAPPKPTARQRQAIQSGQQTTQKILTLLSTPRRYDKLDYHDPTVQALANQGVLKIKQGYVYAGAKPLSDKQLRTAYVNADLKRKLKNPTLEMPAAPKILGTLTRPEHAIMGAADALLTGKGTGKALEAFNKGASGKGKVGGGEVLQHLGVKSKFLQGTLGFGLDIVADPLTGVTLGAGAVGEKAVTQAAEAAGKRALADGATVAEARGVAQTAAREAAAKAGPKGKGLTVKFYGMEAPGVRRGTAAVNRGSKKLPGKRLRAEAKDVAREVNPHLAPRGVPIELHQHVENAAAAARAQIHDGEREAAAIAQGIKSKVPADQYATWLNSIETQTYDKLPKPLGDAARRVDEIQRELHNVATAEGIPIGDITKARIRIPEVTANPKATGKALREAQTRRSVAERANRSQIRKSGVAEGRAQVLVKQSDRKAGAKAASNKPVRTLTKLERQRSKLNPAEQEVQNARQAVKDATTAHEAEVALHRVQKAERKVATPPYMRAAVKELDQALAERAKAVARQEGPRILKGRTKTDLTKAKQDFPSANDLEYQARLEANAAHQKALENDPQFRGLGPAGRPFTDAERKAMRKAEADRKFAAANKPREALGPVDFADRKVAAAQAKVDALNADIAKGFVSHKLTDILEPAGGGYRTEGVGSKTIRLDTLNKRRDLRTIAAQNAETPGKFSTDAPLLTANYVASLRTGIAKAKFNKALMATGRRVAYSRKPVQLADGESLWVIHGANIHEFKPGEAKIPGADYVALNKALAEHHIGNVQPMAGRTKFGEYFDHATGLWKRSKTFSLAFHARNAIGDTNMAYLVPGRSFRRTMIEAGQGGKVLKAARRMDKQQRNLEAFGYSGKTIKVGNERIPVEDVVQRLRHAGAIDTGYISRELRDIRGGSTDTRVLSKVPGRGRLKRVMEDRENLHRAGTALHGLGKGMTDEEAGALSRAYHIDYGNLSKTEKVALRRAMPFYTFTARGLPIFVKALAKSPGKFAAYEKLIEETARATGTDRDKAYKKLQVFEQQQVPLIVGGKQAGASVPINLLNLLPDPSQGSKSAHLSFDQAMGLVNPLLKTPLEVMSNHSFFTHRPILDPKGNPYAAAPDWVKGLPKSLQKKLGVIDNYIDPRTGKKILGWNPYSQYAMGQMPALVTQASGLLTGGTSQRGQNLKQKAIADITGVKIAPIGGVTNRLLDDLWGKYNRAQFRMNQLRHQQYKGQAISADNPTAEYTRLLAQSKDLSKKINAASVASGDKTPSFRSRRKPNPQADALARKLGLPAAGATKTDAGALAKKLGLPQRGATSSAEREALRKKLGLP